MPLSPAKTAELNAIVAALPPVDEQPEGYVDAMAWTLSVAMAGNPQARARYREIYGREWTSLVPVALIGQPLDPDRHARSLERTRVG